MSREQRLWLLRQSFYVSFGALGGAAIFVTEVWPRGDFLERYGPEAAGGLIGVSLTLLVVERILRWERETSLRPLRERAMARLVPALYDLVLLLTQMYKAAAPRGSPTYAYVDDLVEGWRREVGRLNFCARPPSDDQSWFEYATRMSQQVGAQLETLLDRYAEPLGIELTTAIEDVLTHHHFRSTLASAISVPIADQNAGRDRREYLPFGADNPLSVQARNEFADRLRCLYQTLQAHSTSGARPHVPEALWTHVAPDWSSARFDGIITPHNE